MKGYEKLINNQYGKERLSDSIFEALEKAGKEADSLARDDIAGFDEFHIRGREATRELAELADLQNVHVLDIGAGLGGPARTLSAEFGCRVTGIDLTEAYCRTAEALTQKVGLAERISFFPGDATDMTFDSASFDVAWMVHTAMNIEDKPRLVDEIGRVLKPAGRFAFYEIFGGENSPPHFPVPWADGPELNFLADADEFQRMLEEAGFEKHTVRDVTQLSLKWFGGVFEKMQNRSNEAPPPLGLNLLMRESTPAKIKNMVQNLEERRIKVVQAVYSLPG